MALRSQNFFRLLAAGAVLVVTAPAIAGAQSVTSASSSSSASSTASSTKTSTSSAPSTSTKSAKTSANSEERETTSAEHSDAQRLETGTIFDTAPVLTHVIYDTSAAQMSFYNIDTDEYYGTVSDRFQRPALSLSKLFLAQYVYEYGTAAQAELATTMLEQSNDVIADTLYNVYPAGIDAVAEEFNLQSTTTNGQRWGFSLTSTYDVVYFVYQLLHTDPHSPVLEAMRNQAKIAADGTAQNYGTSQIAGEEGSKFGWADDLSLHSTVSFGDNWIAAVAVTGSADDATEFAEFQLTDLVNE
ncbi:MAG: hypothetical protein Q3976_00105 [Corynebacterium sp.]|nr:hypothetical protein [Corynebacterium sp.]